MRFTDLTDGTLDALRSAGTYLTDLATPTVRLGVTGLSRAGKTVFITALIRNLTAGGRLPFFAPYAEGRIERAFLEPQPDDDVPRFDYEGHLAALAGDPTAWPESTRRISQLRITVEYRPVSMLARALSSGRLHIDIVDYPGEWLADLGLLDRSYEDWSREAIGAAREPRRHAAAAPWLAVQAALDPAAPQDEMATIEAARAFTAYLAAARQADPALPPLGPGRFLMPGDLAGSPLLTFVPLDLPAGWAPPRGSLAALMERRYESYKAQVVRPFFRDHFARLDRQIVLVDVLAALNEGASAIDDLTRVLQASLQAMRPGANTWLSSILGRRIDRVLYAATKADHLPRSSHDRLEAAFGLIIEKAAERARFAGADIKVLALAALRATREAEVRRDKETLACIRGTPMAGERLGPQVFDGRTEVAVFPGDLPADPKAFTDAANAHGAGGGIRSIRFRPPVLASEGVQVAPDPWPHIRLDRALDFLIGDRLR